MVEAACIPPRLARTPVGGVTHCTFHCRLAKFRELMIHAKHSDVIGWNNPITWNFRQGTHKDAICLANHNAVFYVDNQVTEFRQTTV